jgi:hypothetical protein
VASKVVDGLVLIRFTAPGIALGHLVLKLLILEIGHRQQVLEKEVQQYQRVKLQIGVTLLIKADLDTLNNNLGEVEPLLIDIFDLHDLALLLLFLRGLEIAEAVCKLVRGLGNGQLVDGFRHAELRIVIGDNFQNLMALEPE